MSVSVCLVAQQATLSDALAVDDPPALPAYLSVCSRLEPFKTGQRQIPTTTFTDHILQFIDKNHQNPFILIETLSQMLWLSAFPCEQAPCKSPHPHHQSFQDFYQNEGKNIVLLCNTEKPLRTEILKPQMTQISLT